MKRITPKQCATIFLAFGLCIAGCGGPNADSPQKQAATKSDADQIQGTWTAITGSDNGKSFAPKEDRHGKIVVSGDEFDMYEGATSPGKWKFHLEPAKSPKQIDFTMGDKQALGIYQLDADHLKMAMTLPGKERPIDSEGAPDILVLEFNRGDRVKPPQ